MTYHQPVKEENRDDPCSGTYEVCADFNCASFGGYDPSCLTLGHAQMSCSDCGA